MRRPPSFRRRLFAGFLAASLIPTLACSAMMLQVFRLRMAGEAEREMTEHLTAASAAALTIYDMCKAVQRDMEIGDIRLCRKSGGKIGEYVKEW